jgi:hypothetical protein
MSQSKRHSEAARRQYILDAEDAQERHAIDLVQSRLPDGSVNPDFLELYPIQSMERGLMPELDEEYL